MKAIHRSSTHISITWEPGELNLLRSLPPIIRQYLTGEDFGDKVLGRLYPKMAVEEKLDKEMRDLLTADVRASKLQHVDTFEKSLSLTDPKTRETRISIEQADAWVAAINDLRLMLGVLIGIEDESWGKDIDPRRPPSREVAIYLYLTHLQGAILHHAFGIEQPPI